MNAPILQVNFENFEESANKLKTVSLGLHLIPYVPFDDPGRKGDGGVAMGNAILGCERIQSYHGLWGSLCR